MVQCKADEFRALGGESARVEYPTFGVAQGVSLAGTHNAIKEPSRSMSTGHGIVYSVCDILDFNPVPINVVFDFFKVSLLNPVDIDNFIRDIDSYKFKVWSILTKEQRDGVIDIVGVLLD
nr:hypothetical protein [Tanacetum cinerariifolium]